MERLLEELASLFVAVCVSVCGVGFVSSLSSPPVSFGLVLMLMLMLHLLGGVLVGAALGVLNIAKERE